MERQSEKPPLAGKVDQAADVEKRVREDGASGIDDSNAPTLFHHEDPPGAVSGVRDLYGETESGGDDVQADIGRGLCLGGRGPRDRGREHERLTETETEQAR